MIAIGVALAAALAEIETIVASGPLLSVLGLAIAGVSASGGLWRGMCYGVSVPVISTVCFALIHFLSWGPQEATAPVQAILGAFALASLLLGHSALWEAEATSAVLPPRRFQFRLSALFALIFVLSPTLALYRLGSTPGTMAALLTYGILVSFVIYRFLWERDRFGPSLGSMKAKA
jgi:hypothetical protein